MAHWLYRYVFRGIGIVFLLGILTILFLEIRYVNYLSRHAPAKPAGQSDVYPEVIHETTSGD